MQLHHGCCGEVVLSVTLMSSDPWYGLSCDCSCGVYAWYTCEIILPVVCVQGVVVWLGGMSVVGWWVGVQVSWLVVVVFVVMT